MTRGMEYSVKIGACVLNSPLQDLKDGSDKLVSRLSDQQMYL